MCLLVLAWRNHPQYRLVVAANRDEFHARPAAPLAPWTDIEGIIGGRDLQANGAWFAVDTRRRFGIVTNFREFGRRRRSAPSRGGLFPATWGETAGQVIFCRRSRRMHRDMRASICCSADQESLWYASNRADQFARELPPGIYGLSNEFLDTPWPKLVRVRARFETLLQSAESADRRRGRTVRNAGGPRNRAPDTVPAGDISPEWARKLSAPFVLDPRLWHALLDSADHRGPRRLSASPSAASMPAGATGQSEHVLNGNDEH